MKLVFIIYSLSIVSFFTNAQNVTSSGLAFYLNPMESTPDPGLVRRGIYVGPHVLGDTITELKNRFESLYVYFRKTAGAYSVEEKVVLKSQIYKSINRVDKELSREYAGNVHLLNSYRKRLEKIYSIGIKLILYETGDFEKKLKLIKSNKEVEEFLMSVQFR